MLSFLPILFIAFAFTIGLEEGDLDVELNGFDSAKIGSISEKVPHWNLTHQTLTTRIGP